jgi:hypothetical protein
LTLKGEAEVRAWFKALPDEVAAAAARDGLRKASARLRTLIRRAAPKKTGTLRKAIQSRVGKKKTAAWVGVKKLPGEKNARNYYATLEKGRKPHTRKGASVKGSPQMAQYAFFRQAWQSHKSTIAQVQIEATRSAIAKRAIQAARKAGARGIRAR